MKYTANQPLLFPSIYMLNRFISVDHLVIMNEAQFSKFGLHQRILLSDKNQTKQLPHVAPGENMIVMPLGDRNFKPIDEVRTHEFPKFVQKFCRTLSTLYGKNARERIDLVREVLADLGPQPTLAEVGTACIELACSVAGAHCQLHTSRELIGQRPDDPSDWVLAMGRAINCTAYVGGGTAMNAYIKREDFAAAGIELISQDWKCPAYKTPAGEASNGWLSFLDPWMLHGESFVQDMIR